MFKLFNLFSIVDQLATNKTQTKIETCKFCIRAAIKIQVRSKSKKM